MESKPNPTSLPSWPTAELVEMARLTGWRRRLHDTGFMLGCLPSLALLVVAVFLLCQDTTWHYIVLYLIYALVLGVPFAGLITLLVGMGAERWATWSVRPYLTELQRRFGYLELPAYEEEEWAVPGRACSVLVIAKGLPHGNRRWTRIRTLENGGCEYEAVAGDHGFVFHRGLDPGSAFQCRRLQLPQDQTVELATLLRAMEPGKEDKIRSTVLDGLRCTMVVLFARRGQKASLSCNLMGLPPEARELPSVRLLRHVLDLDRLLNPRAEVLGACDAQGNVTIAEDP